MADTKALEGKVALVTGAGRGIGRATCELFAKHGADLVLVSRTESELEGTAKKCAAHGAKPFVRPTDISSPSDVDDLFIDLLARFPRVDILVNNAGIFHGAPMEEFDLDKFREVMKINVEAPLYLSQKMLKTVDPEAGGAIVNISSYSGCFGTSKFPRFGAYNMSKYALWGLTEILALECEEKGVRVNQVSPAGVDTRMFREAVGEGVTPGLKPEDVAEKILYFASDESAPATGQNVMVPG